MTLRSSRSALTVFIAVACGFVWFAGNAAAASITLNATVEGTIKDSDGAPIGVFDVLQAGGEPSGVPSVERNLVGLGNPHERRGVLEFDFSGIPVGATITGVPGLG